VGGVTATGVLFLIAVMTMWAPVPPAQASNVVYGEGCALIRVDSTDLHASQSGTIVPGKSNTVLTAVVRNPTRDAVQVTLGGAGGPQLSGVITFTPTVAGVPAESTVLSPGQTMTVALTATLPASADNSAQGLAGAPALTLIATQQ
jgi:hypothetical protein